MLSRYPLLIFITFFSLVANIGNAGVMCKMSEKQLRSLKSPTIDSVANLALRQDQNQQPKRCDECPGSGDATVAPTSVTTTLSASFATPRFVMAKSQQVAMLELINQSVPPDPDLNGLLKPPQLKSSSTV